MRAAEFSEVCDYSAAELARLVGRSRHTIAKELERVR